MKGRIIFVAALACAASAATAVAPASAFKTSVQPYLKPIGSSYVVDPLLSVGDRVPETTTPAQQYQMIGIPDGLGARSAGGSSVELFMNHELTQGALAEAVVGQPRYRGAFVSKYVLGPGGDVISGERAYDTVFNENALLGDAPTEGNATAAFGRLCSASLADQSVGFDRPIFMTGEESGGAGTFDGLGGTSVAIFDNEAHSLPNLGHFAKENQIVMPETGSKTVVFPLEDGPASPDSQLYMYVGDKDPGSSTVLGKNGLDAGKLYVLKLGPLTNEDDLQAGAAFGTWVEIPNADTLTDAQLETASDAAGGFGFYRIEDGAASKTSKRNFYFVTTGAGGTNRLGRIYRLTYDPANPTAGPLLRVVENADTVFGAGGDTAVSPDNIDTSSEYLMVNEDGTTESRLAMASQNRDASVWRFDLDSGFARERVAELSPPGRDGIAVGPGVWESSGVIDASGLYGPDSWIVDVQAHGPSQAPVANTIEDGQLLLMRPAPVATPPGPPANPPGGGTAGKRKKSKKCKPGKKRGKCKKSKR